jgi:hypothetical protein
MTASVVYGWTNPTAAPPGANPPAPINVGSATQTKTGGLNIQGNVGIGTASPAQRLHLSGSGSQWMQVSDTTVGSIAYFGIEGGVSKILSAGSGIAFRTDGGGWSDKMTITSAGNVGIGTTAPTDRLHVIGDIRATGNVFGTFAGAINAGNVTPGTFNSLQGGGGNYTFPVDLIVNRDIVVGRPQAIYGATHRQFILHGAWNNLYIAPRNDANTDWLWDRLVIQSGGNVGIGTTAPGARLDVAGEIRTGSLRIGHVHDRISSTGGLFLQVDQPGNILMVAGGGNVGIGTTAPGARLEVDTGGGGIAGGALFLDRASLGEGLRIFHPETGDYSHYPATDNWSYVRGAGMRIFRHLHVETGNVGIGTTAPGTRLEVRGADTQTAIFRTRGWVNDRAISVFFDAHERFWVDTEGDAFIHGNVGIGTTAPGFRLDVASAGGTTARFGTVSTDRVIIGGGAGKLDVGTIDPVYNINGEKFATYAAWMIGQKEETTGVIRNWRIVNGNWQAIIDFASAEKGSDAWLFYQISDFGKGKSWEDLVVLLTPNFEGRVWYQKDSANEQLIVFARPITNDQLPITDYEVSYRLTAPRFDHAKWTNIPSDTYGITGLLVEFKN